MEDTKKVPEFILSNIENTLRLCANHFNSYDKMLEMAESGAKVLHTKCVKMAKENNVPIIVKSTFIDNEGTIVK